MEEIIKTLREQGALEIKDGSFEAFIDDEGIVQEIIFRRNRRKRPGETLAVKPQQGGHVRSNFSADGTLMQLIIETVWKRKFDNPKRGS